MKKIITVQHPQSEQHTNGMIGSLGDWDLTEHGIFQEPKSTYVFCSRFIIDIKE